ncbi:MAG: hypothetical protein ABIJ09_20835 [Pseudomonadota bacterium]
MRIGLTAGSRGDVARLDQALTQLAGSLQCERILFLGDRVADLDALVPAPPATAIDGDAGFLAAVTDFMLGQQGQAAPPTSLLERYGVPVLGVAEKGSARHQQDPASAKHLDMLGMSIVLAVHDKNDLVKEDIANAALILHGDGDAPAVVQIGTRAFITPGPLAEGGGHLGVLSEVAGGFGFDAYDLHGTSVHSQVFNLRRTAKFSVK